jgi:hypothetical protein
MTCHEDSAWTVLTMLFLSSIGLYHYVRWTWRVVSAYWRYLHE